MGGYSCINNFDFDYFRNWKYCFTVKYVYIFQNLFGISEKYFIVNDTERYNKNDTTAYSVKKKNLKSQTRMCQNILSW